MQQCAEQHDSVLLAVEAGVIMAWHERAGDHGDIIELDRLGASAPALVVMREYAMTAERVCQRALALLKRHST